MSADNNQNTVSGLRIDGRTPENLRPIKFTRNWLNNAEGSVLVEFGNTRVLCVASFTPGVPRWLVGKGGGWVTSEYAMLPRATHTRSDRESVKGKLGGRTQEISRLVGRSLRAIEIPIRKGIVQNWFRGMKYRTKVMQKRQQIFVASITAFIVVISGSSVALAWQRDQSIILEIKPELELPDTVMAINKTGLWVTGDSVILGIRNKLAMQEEIALINARVGRQIQELIAAVEEDKPLVGSSPVVLNVGNNNAVSREDMVKLMELLKDQPKVVVVNTSVSRTWREGNNKIISEVVAGYPNAVLVNWAEIAENHPEFFAPDGVHLIEAGSDVYVASILEALNAD